MKSGPVWALGAMSGTSLDGVDAAMIQTDGRDVFAFGRSAYRAYDERQREGLRAALGREAVEPGVAAAAAIVEIAHAKLMMPFEEADVVGFHGQTLTHAPQRGVTHQVGDGWLLAALLGKPVVWDFRSADVELGGQGAPLAPFYHFALAKRLNLDRPAAFLNLGGVGNLTWIDPKAAKPEDPGALLAFDTGPANAPIDDLMRARRGARCDGEGALAARGTIDERVVDDVLSGAFFARMPPKSLDRNDFANALQAVGALDDADAAATLAAVAAASVARGLEHCPERPDRLLVAGGGRKNPVLMRMLAERTGLDVMPVEAEGLDGDMLEAQAFAFLAVRVMRGLPTSAPGTTGVSAAVGGGRVSHPLVQRN